MGVIACGSTMYFNSPSKDGDPTELWPAGDPPLAYRMHLRLCFSQPSEAQLVEAARRLGEACAASAEELAELARASL